MSDVTRILSQIESGDPSAAEGLLPLIYDELRALAATKMADESPDNTLQATALVHEAYVRLVDVDEAQHWDSRWHFFSAAAEAMRRILVEIARRKRSLKMGGDIVRQDLDKCEISLPEVGDDILAVNEALEEFAGIDTQAFDLVKLRYFAGFTIAEAAKLMGISPRKANQIWAYARVWLLDKIQAEVG